MVFGRMTRYSNMPGFFLGLLKPSGMVVALFIARILFFPPKLTALNRKCPQ
jgi:hypothetical protein